MYYTKKTIVFHNGNFVKATEAKTDLFSQTLHYGSGVFDGIRAYETVAGTQAFKIREHYERLIKSSARIHIKVPYTAEELVNITYRLLEDNKLDNAYIRPLVYLGPNMRLTKTNEVNIFISAWKWPRYQLNDQLDVMLSSFQRPNPKASYVDAKITGNYINSILATQEAKLKGFDEALLLDSGGFIAQSPGDNFFMEKDGVLFTPPEGHILPGITRKTIKQLAKELDFEVVERLFTVQELEAADGAFFTGTATEVAGIKSFNHQAFKKKWEDTMGYQLFTKYKQIVTHGEYDSYSII
ncbi:branched-chain amino acid transaminase [Chondrinema litorale]|uniref:branched-chain amino acid transaminase n=1 Tax=Chondrinema litorale TaxID=2994555 RepID=UPI002543A62E|nr:branched-chain amino acid transaminase [Chondrinema litorale]UZR94841.1 branched-chain amino acid transaminase [Chondrinema litorale]